MRSVVCVVVCGVAERFVYADGWLRSVPSVAVKTVWFGVPRKLPRRATTRREFWTGVPVAVLVPARADVFALRGITRLAVDSGVVFTTVSIKFEFWVGVTPGFKLVRI